MLRNFIHTISRFKLASTLNIIGLSLSFAAFILIMIQVRYEFTAATDQPNHENIYRLQNRSNSEKNWSINIFKDVSNRFIESTPQVKESALFLYGSRSVVMDGTVYERIPCMAISNDISKVFQIEMLEGIFSSALEPNSAIISQSTARRLFGDQPAMGQKIEANSEYNITGVYKDFAENSALTNGLILAGRKGQTVNSVYCLFSEGTDTETLAADFNAKAMKELSRSGTDIVKLVPLADTYFDNQFVDNSFVQRGSRTTTLVLLAIAVLIMVIAMINFINFSTALAPIRIRALNIRGVFGSTRSALRVGIVGEALLFAMVSYCIALIIIYIIGNTPIIELFKTKDLTLSTNHLVIAFTALMVVVIGLMAGLYPAFYCTRFKPALVLKGSFGLSTHGRILRSGLLGFQFIVSIALIITAIFVQLQNRYLLQKNLGYDSENIITIESLYDSQKSDLVIQKVNALASVKGVSKFNGSFGIFDGDMIEYMAIDGDTIQVNSYFVDDRFIDMMGIPIVAGRGLMVEDQELSEDLITNVIINQTALRELNTALDSVIRTSVEGGYRVVGIAADVISHSMHNGQIPIMYMKSQDIWTIAIKVDCPQSLQAMEMIRNIVKQVEPVELWKINFFDANLAALYDNERNLAKLVLLFSIMAIVISLMGVFGLVVFETQYRRKEIGLRKINGATIINILEMFNRRFIWIVVGCFVVATPLAWYGVNQWLGGFAYRTPIYWWVFALALIIVLAMTLLTVTIQSWRAATENPIKSLKSE